MNTICTNSTQSASAQVLNKCTEVINTKPTNTIGRSKRQFWAVRAYLKVKAYVVRKHNQRIDRAAFNNLLTLDEDLLKDIGVSRADIIYASNLPLETDASRVIEDIARRRYSNRRNRPT